jgi:hypothetical protein
MKNQPRSCFRRSLSGVSLPRFILSNPVVGFGFRVVDLAAERGEGLVHRGRFLDVPLDEQVNVVGYVAAVARGPLDEPSPILPRPAGLRSTTFYESHVRRLGHQLLRRRVHDRSVGRRQ